MIVVFWIILCSIIEYFFHDPMLICFISIGFVSIILVKSQESLEVRIEEKIDRIHARIDKFQSKIDGRG
jgi:hypothetical protein